MNPKIVKLPQMLYLLCLNTNKYYKIGLFLTKLTRNEVLHVNLGNLVQNIKKRDILKKSASQYLGLERGNVIKKTYHFFLIFMFYFKSGS